MSAISQSENNFHLAKLLNSVLKTSPTIRVVIRNHLVEFPKIDCLEGST